MNRISLLVAMMVVLSGCQGMGAQKAGTTNSRSGLYDGTRSVLYQVQEDPSSADQVMRIAGAAYQAGDLDQALYQYLRAMELDPKRYEALVWVGRIHRERGNQQLAEMAFTDVLSSAPDNVDALAEMGLLNLAMRRHDEALAMLSKAQGLDQKRLGGSASAEVANLKVDSHSPLKVYNGLGVLADLANDSARAATYYQLALRIEPRSALVQNSLGYSHYMAGDWGEAEQAYKLGISYDSHYKPLWRNYGLLLARTGRYEEAISVFGQVESNAQASNDVGYVSLIEGKLDVAEQFFRSAIEQSPTHYDEAWQNLNRVQQIRKIREVGSSPAAAAVAVVPQDALVVH